MKLYVLRDLNQKPESPPVRGRGLKLNVRASFIASRGVAPRAGAWIETIAIQRKPSISHVAPRAGAWIETVIYRRCSGDGPGRPPCGGVD